MIETNKRLLRAYEIYKDRGERFKKVDGVKEAETNFSRAKKLLVTIEDLSYDIKIIENYKDSHKK